MIICRECNLDGFDAWGGATDTLDNLMSDEMDTIQDNIEQLYPNGIDVTELNDFLAYETDTIADWLGFASWEDLIAHHKEDEDV